MSRFVNIIFKMDIKNIFLKVLTSKKRKAYNDFDFKFKKASVDEEEYILWTCQRADGWCESV